MTLAAVCLMSVAATGTNAADYLIGASGKNLNSLNGVVSRAGGTLERTFPFGIAVASSDDPAFAENLYDIANIQFVVEDVGFEVVAPVQNIAADFGYPPNSGDDDFFFDLQWGHNYVGAQEAWADGFFGQGVNVAVLDGGFDVDHPDLVANIVDTADMTGQGVDYACPDPFSHGTHVAGTIGAVDNGYGVIGVAPQVNLMLVKVLFDEPPPSNPAGVCSGTGSFADVIEGIYYAAENGADVINMSLGDTIARIGAGGNNAAISALQNAVSQAMTWAYQQGVTVIVSAGNAASDLDGGDASSVRFNNGLSHAVGISALAPENWATNGNVPLDPASYTNYGTSSVDFGAPGGDFDYPGNEGCVVAGLLRPCWIFDMVFSAGGNGGWYWSAGTSMASPHAAGVAALIISETGDANPAHVIREMRRRASDAGKPGRDDVYGHGITNSGR
ncbi:MAG: S8 family serine peptidase [Woeseiaceae bacterium]